MAAQTRNRAKKPVWRFGAYNLANWQADVRNIAWARSDEFFKTMLTVVINERERALHAVRPNTTENCMLGLLQGYDQCIDVLKSLADAPGQPRNELPIEYKQPMDPEEQLARAWQQEPVHDA
jgi:hypothetical protein